MKHYDLGFLGGGQLARMSIQAAQRMGLECLSLDPACHTPAAGVADARVGPLDDPEAVGSLLRLCDRVTLENEFIPAGTIRAAYAWAGADESKLTPGIDTLATIQDKLFQRQALMKDGVPSPRAVASDRGDEIGFPRVLKARFGGYDGKGTRYARTPKELTDPGPGWLAEEFVPFRRELAVMVYRDRHTTGAFPTVETVQTHHVCDLVFPCDADGREVAIAAVEAVGGYGLFGVELFECQDGSLKVNELAPRPHNTGHYTLDWGGVSQFEQHVRLAWGLPTVEPHGAPTCMANLLGRPGADEWREGLRAALAGDSGVRVHWYGKAESRPGRKMGHLNAVGPDCVERAKRARSRFYAAWTGQTS